MLMVEEGESAGELPGLFSTMPLLELPVRRAMRAFSLSRSADGAAITTSACQTPDAFQVAATRAAA